MSERDRYPAGVPCWAETVQPDTTAAARLAMSTLLTRNPADATAFYGELFGWRPEPLDLSGTAITPFRRPGYAGGEPRRPVPRDEVAVMHRLDPGPAPSHWKADFWIDDAQAAAATAMRLGGRVVVPLEDSPFFRTVVLADRPGRRSPSASSKCEGTTGTFAIFAPVCYNTVFPLVNVERRWKTRIRKAGSTPSCVPTPKRWRAGRCAINSVA